MAVNDIFSLTFNWGLGPEPAANVYHYRQTVDVSGNPRSTLCNNLITLAVASAQTFLTPNLASLIILQTVDCFVVNDDTAFATQSPAIPGDLTGEVVSKRSAPVAKLSTSLRGRSFQGRKFFPPPLETQQANGTLIASHVTDLQTYLDDTRILIDGSGDTFRLTIFSPTMSILPDGPFIDNLVTTSQVRQILGSIRGRQDVI